MTEAGWEVILATSGGRQPVVDQFSRGSGGHGPMEGLAVDETSGALLTRRLASGRPLASLAAKNPDGSWPFAGCRMTGLSNVEERLNPFAWKAKWLLEDRLKQAGAYYTAGLPLKSGQD